MSEDHRLVGEVRGEPLPAGRVGVRVRVQLSGCPSRRWTRDLTAHLADELRGHAAMGHLRLNVCDIVEGDQLVLEGVDASAAPALGQALQRAIDAANLASTRAPNPPPNVEQEKADAIAREIADRRP